MKKLLFSCTILLLAFCACSRMDFSQEESLTEAQFASVSKDDGFDWGKLDSLLGTLPDLTAAYVGKLRPIPYNTGFVLINEDWSTPYEIYMKPLNMGNKVKVTYKVDPLDYRDSTPVLSHWDILEGDGKGGYIVRTQSTPLNDSSFTYIITQQDLYGVTFFRPYLNMIPKPKIPVTVVAADPSMGTVSGSGQYCANGRFFEISATPNAGYEFYRWEAVGTKEGWQDKLPTMFSENAPNTSVQLQHEGYAFTIKAHFKHKEKKAVTVETDQYGTVSGGGLYNIGSSYTIHATPNSGYQFAYWTQDGKVVSDNPNYTVTATDNNPVTYVAHYKTAYADMTLDIRYLVMDDAYQSQSRLNYQTPSGEWLTTNLQTMTNTFTIRGATRAQLYIDISSPNFEPFYCMYRDMDGSVSRLNSGDMTLVSQTMELNISREYGEIIIRADSYDFSGEFYNQRSGQAKK